MQRWPTAWRLPGRLHVISLGLTIRDGAVLVSAVARNDGKVIGWRPPGGNVEFDELAEAGLRREFIGEFGATMQEVAQLGIVENLYSHAGDLGHDVVCFVSHAA
jgi:ADP-ribose pyrophosphatase YjhB (NUDIX family)